jgi:hypothetical protein
MGSDDQTKTKAKDRAHEKQMESKDNTKWTKERVEDAYPQ